MKTHNLSIVIYCDGLEFDGETLEKKSLGGSETAALQMGIALKNRGHQVKIFSNCEGSYSKPGLYDGIEFKPCREFHSYATTTEHDVLIVSRRHQVFNLGKFKSRLNILWTQDHAWLNDIPELHNAIWNIDKVFALTEWHKNTQASTWNLPIEMFWTGENGIDLDFINEKTSATVRNYKKLIYTSRPERGLFNLVVNVLPRLLQFDPELKLYVTTYDSFSPQILNLINNIKQLSQGYKDSIVWLPPLNKDDLYKELKSSYLYLYPSDYEEGYCIAAAESMACGTPVICGNWGAIMDVLPDDCGVKIKGHKNAYNSVFISDFINRTIELLNNRQKWGQCSKNCLEKSKDYDWKVRAEIWEDKFNELLENKQKNKLTVISRASTSDEILMRMYSINADEFIFASDCDELSTENDKAKIVKITSCDKALGNDYIWNKCLKQATGDWVLWLDTDESLLGAEKINKYIQSGNIDAYSFKNDGVYPDSPIKIFRNNGDFKFVGLIRERVCLKDDINSCGFSYQAQDVSLIKAESETSLQDYFKTDFKKLQEDIGKYTNREVGLLYFMMDLLTIAENNPGIGYLHMKDNKPDWKINQEADKCCNEVIRLYEKHFKNADSKLKDVATSLYSRANNMLMQGLEVEFTVRFNSRGEGSNPISKKLRVKNKDDLLQHFGSFFNKQADHYFSKWYLS